MGAGRVPLPPTHAGWVLVGDTLIWCRISGETSSWNDGTQTQFVEGSLCCSWSRLRSAQAQAQDLEKPFQLLNTKLPLVFQSWFQQLLMLKWSCCKSWLKRIRCSCFSYVVACFYRNILFLFYRWHLDSCYKTNLNPIFGLWFILFFFI